MTSPDRGADADLRFPGEPGVETDARPPFIADHPTTRWLFALNRKGIRPGLGRVRGLLDDLGNPERDLTTLVVAGTNGKGSTTRILARLLQDAGLRVACYTSPHLLRVYERLTLDDRPVAPEIFHAAVERLRPAVDRHEASWFETLTAASVLVAREAEVDVLCCETGLGGRLDASNALPAVATLLTGVALDHQHILGDTREAIAAEKLGLLKEGTPFFTSVDAELRGQAFAAAVAAGAPAYFLDELARVERGVEDWSLSTRRRRYDGLPHLGGGPMRRNAALALLCLEELEERDVLPLPDDPAASLGRVFLPGRAQRVTSGPALFVDTAHNVEALTGLLERFAGVPVSGRRHLVFGGMHDKDPGPGPGEAVRRFDSVTFTPVSLPRSRNREGLESLMDLWGLAGDTDVEIVADPGAALARIERLAAPGDHILATGSCFLVAEVLWRLGVRDLEETRTVRPAAEVFGRLEEE